MFYSEYVLTKKGAFAKIWLAAHWDRKLTKTQIAETDIEEAVKQITESDVPIALRTSGHLLLGVVKIHSRKVKYVLSDCNEILTKIKLQVLPETKVDLSEKQSVASVNAITLPEKVTELDLIIPEYDLTSLLTANQAAANAFITDTIQTFEEEEAPGRRLVARMQDITLDDFDHWYPEDESAPTFGAFGQTQTPQTGRVQPTPGSVDDQVRREAPEPTDELFQTGIPFAVPTHEDETFGGPGGFDAEDFIQGRISEIPPTTPQQGIQDAIRDVQAPTRNVVQPPSRKRPRNLQVDSSIEIPTKRFKKMLDTEPTREQRFAPRTPHELSAQQNVDIDALPTLSDLLKQPASGTDLPAPFLEVYRKNLETVNVRNPIAPAQLLRREEPFETPAKEPRGTSEEPIEPLDFGGTGGFGDEDFVIPPVTPGPTTPAVVSPVPTTVLPVEDELMDIVTNAYRTPEERRRLSRALGRSVHLDEAEQVQEEAPFSEEERRRIIEEQAERERVLREQSRIDQEQLRRQVTEKGITERTLKVMNIFNETLKHQDEINFNRMVDSKKRVTAARCFYELLVLKTRNFVDVEQRTPYSDIIVTKPVA